MSIYILELLLEALQDSRSFAIFNLFLRIKNLSPQFYYRSTTKTFTLFCKVLRNSRRSRSFVNSRSFSELF